MLLRVGLARVKNKRFRSQNGRFGTTETQLKLYPFGPYTMFLVELALLSTHHLQSLMIELAQEMLGIIWHDFEEV